jgi:hypothetical protein
VWHKVLRGLGEKYLYIGNVTTAILKAVNLLVPSTKGKIWASPPQGGSHTDTTYFGHRVCRPCSSAIVLDHSLGALSALTKTSQALEHRIGT